MINEYLSGARSIGVKAAEPSAGVVMGQPIAPESEASGQRPLFRIVEALKRELQLSGTTKEVVERAAEELGVSIKGKVIFSLAEECAQVLGV